jgi:hypothetical protein
MKIELVLLCFLHLRFVLGSKKPQILDLRLDCGHYGSSPNAV